MFLTVLVELNGSSLIHVELFLLFSWVFPIYASRPTHMYENEVNNVIRFYKRQAQILWFFLFLSYFVN